ncbi:MAG: hypothetical protein R2766_02850 [Saprospiraceae bacterium]
MYYYDGNLEYIGTLTAPNVNGIGYYCGSGADRAIYGMQRPGEDPINAVRANLVKINVETGVTEVLGEISQPMNIYGPTGVTGIFNYIADVTEDGHYLFPAMTALINPTNLEIIDYTVYLGDIDLNDENGLANVSYTPIAVLNSCNDYMAACVNAFQSFAINPNQKEPSGGIQDWVISPDGSKIYGF